MTTGHKPADIRTGQRTDANRTLFEREPDNEPDNIVDRLDRLLIIAWALLVVAYFSTVVLSAIGVLHG